MTARGKQPYVVNLDPAVLETPYPVNIGKAASTCVRGADLKQSVIGRSPSRGQIKEGD